jgi:hypothetical protein
MGMSDITDRADRMKSGSALETQQMPQHLSEGCLECAADVLSKILDLSRQVPVPEELVQAAIRVFPAPPPPARPSSAPALPLLSPRFTCRLEAVQPEPLQVEADAGDGMMDGETQTADSTEAVVMAGTSSNR